MKAHKIIKSILALALAVIAVSSCQEKMKGFGFSKGEAVKFSVGTAGSSTDTKATYAGNTTTLGEKERIDWEEGDLIRIYCAQASEPETQSADYKVTDDITPSGALSKAHIECAGGVGLRWGTGDHYFYAVYPSPASGGIATEITGKDVAATLASEQGYKDASSAEGSWTVTPDLKWMLMTAKSGPYKEEDGIPSGKENVFLDFHPLTTAVKFTVTNGTTSAMPIKKVMLISKASKISGTFSVDLDASPSADGYLPTGGTPAGTEVSIDLSAKSISLAAGKSLTFTFFLAPTQDIDDLTFRFYKDGTNYMQTRLGYTDGSGVNFPRCKKTTVKGIMLPEGVQWTVKYGSLEQSTLAVSKWNKGIDEELALKPKESDMNFIDLGLPSGTLWADRNIGAKSIMDEPACCGDYYAWSKTETYYEQASSNPPIDVEWKDAYSKGYVQDYGFPYEKYNVTDGLKKLEPIDDVANVVLGGGAQIPSVAQWNELLENCFIVKTNNAGYGYVTLTSKINGASIILPAGGFYMGKENTNYGNFGVYYMTSELNSAADLSQVYVLQCGASENLACRLYSRFAGYPVRAVKQKPVPAGFVDLGLSVYWASENLPGYYQFGATSQATGTSWNTTPYYMSGAGEDEEWVFSRYNTVGLTLEASDDAAAVAGKGRVPSVAEWDELRTGCTWTWNGSGFTVSSSNGNSISLPANGNFGKFVGERGYYWANEVGGTYNYDAHYLYFGDNEQPHVVSNKWSQRFNAYGIRPVHD